MKCEDSTCGSRTRKMPLVFHRGLPICPTCQKAQLHVEVRVKERGKLTLMKLVQKNKFFPLAMWLYWTRSYLKKIIFFFYVTFETCRNVDKRMNALFVFCCIWGLLIGMVDQLLQYFAFVTVECASLCVFTRELFSALISLLLMAVSTHYDYKICEICNWHVSLLKRIQGCCSQKYLSLT